MIGTGLAILGAGLLGAGATAYSANKAANVQKDAATQAADIQRQGQDRALAFQQDVYGNQKGNFATARADFEGTKGNLQPFINSGIGANNILASAYGLNGADPALGQSTLERFRQSPDYQFALKGGTEALDNSAAARGGVLGGNQIRAQTEYGAGLATQNLQSYFARLSGMSQQGQTAATNVGSLGNSLGQIGATLGSNAANTNAQTNLQGSNSIAQSTMGAGTADASGILGAYNGFKGGMGELTKYLDSAEGRRLLGGGGSSYQSADTLFGYTGGGYGGGGIGSR